MMDWGKTDADKRAAAEKDMKDGWDKWSAVHASI
jgi:hypothetical protein